ncbi:MAG: hypothetical protein KAR21_04135, partial [Spirochaetales bacterium]|nr:hypothetical protein [Spirochaetales bacterium]
MRIPKNFKKYELYNISVFSLLLLTVIYLNSCNLFFSNPHGRENINDSYAQLTAFTAVPSGDKSIVTMWNWRDALSWTNDDVITEIKIQHSILGYPDNYIFFAGETFTDNNDWQYEWEDLISGITHYFSLFAKASDNDGNDIWYAPLKSKAKLPGTLESSIIYSKDALHIDNAGAEIWDPVPSFLVTNTQWA